MSRGEQRRFVPSRPVPSQTSTLLYSTCFSILVRENTEHRMGQLGQFRSSLHPVPCCDLCFSGILQKGTNWKAVGSARTVFHTVQSVHCGASYDVATKKAAPAPAPAHNQSRHSVRPSRSWPFPTTTKSKSEVQKVGFHK